MSERENVTQDYIIQRINDWEDRITLLINNMCEWVTERPEWKVEKSSVIQRNEYLMKEYDVKPRKLPAINFYNKGERIYFLSSALWIVGANGRINIVTNSKLYILVDRDGKDGAPSNWEYTALDAKIKTKPFDKEAFLKILDDEI